MKSAALRRFYEATGFTVMRAAVLINIAALLGIIGLIVVNAWPAMTWEFLTEPPRDLMTKGGILPCIIGTFCLALGALVIALPLGVASAVYLKEYSQPSVWVTLTRLSIANLAGVPSIVFGLFGLTFFVVFCGFGVSLLSGILTLAVLSLPIIINTTEAALSQIPQDWREASLALGASQRETTLKEVRDGVIVCTAKDGKELEIPCDSVISCAGYISAPLPETGRAKLVGDCRRVGNLRSVVWDAYEAAMKI